MRAEEFLRTLISVLDKLDKKTSEKQNQPVIININGENNSDSADINDNSQSGEEVTDDTGIFIPPLQQHIEILKKNAGIKSAFDGNSILPEL